MNILYFLLLAVVAGAALPLQAALNTKLGAAVDSATYATLLSFIVGALAVGIYVLLARVELANVQNAFNGHWSIWTGGLLGAFYVISLIILTPKLGVALTLGLTVAGQMSFSLIMDHYGWLGLDVQHIDWGKVAGVALIIGGVWLLRGV